MDRPYGAAHFTQVVWLNSKVFGIGKASVVREGMLCTYVVARYDPTGNQPNTFSDNVLKGNFEYSYCDSLGKGGGGKGMSSGAIHNLVSGKDRPWSASDQPGKKKSQLSNTWHHKKKSKIIRNRPSVDKVKSLINSFIKPHSKRQYIISRTNEAVPREHHPIAK